jgi:hypothetical protein
MVTKVTRSHGADSSGIFRRPRLVLKLKRFEDLPTVLSKTKSYPTPIRMVGADYSQTRCVGGDGGTTVDTTALDKIIEFGETLVRAQAGVRVRALVHALAERGLELPLTPEMGQISLGALAVTTLPQASYGVGLAQLSSCVTELKLITPQGKQMIVTEKDRDLMRVIRSSFGLLGVVHEVVLRVRPLTPVKIDYQVLSLKEFGARFTSLINAPGALRLHISPFTDKITVERRTIDESASVSRSGIWQIRNSVMRNVLPAFGSTVGSVLAAPSLRAVMLSGVQRALRATLERSARGVVLYSHEWMRDLPHEAWKARYTLQSVGFPSGRIIRSCWQNTLRSARRTTSKIDIACNVVSSASRLHQDKGSLFSASLCRSHVHSGTFIHGRPRVGGLSHRFQRFRIAAERNPDVQSNARLAARARGQILR